MKTKKYFINILKLLFTCGYLYLLIFMVDWSELVTLYGGITWGTIISCAILYLIINILKAIRFSFLLGTKINIHSLVSITLVHGMYNRVLPLRLGEGMFLHLMKKYHAVSLEESVLTLIAVRIFDLISTLFVLLTALSFYYSVSIFTKFIIIISMLVLSTMCIPVGLSASFFIRSNIRFLRQFIFSNKIESLFREKKNKLNVSNSFRLVVISCFIWVLMFMVFHKILIDLNIDFPLDVIYLSGSFSNLSSILPISSFGNFGTMELGWGGVLLYLGYTSQLALLSGISINAFTFFCANFFGLLGAASLKLMTILDRRAKC